MKQVTFLVILGEITFLHKEKDGIEEATINKLDMVTFGKTIEKAQIIGENYIKKNPKGSYLIPSQYKGKIIY